MPLPLSRISRPEWDVGDINRQRRVLLIALRLIRKLSPEDATLAIMHLTEVLAVSNTEAVIRGRAAILCLRPSATLQDKQVWCKPDVRDEALVMLVQILQLLRRWGVDPRRDLHSKTAQTLGEFVEHLAQSLDERDVGTWVEKVTHIRT